MNDFTIHYLADHPEHIEICAVWNYARWGCQNPDNSLKKTQERFKKSAKKTKLPLTFIALDNTTNMPISMGAIWKKDGQDWPKRTPWIASVFTHYRHRNKGVAKAIITTLENAARDLGYKEIFLHSGSAAAMYQKIGYTPLQTINAPKLITGQRTLFKKDL